MRKAAKQYQCSSAEQEAAEQSQSQCCCAGHVSTGAGPPAAGAPAMSDAIFSLEQK